MARSKVIPAAEAGKLIKDGATLYCSGVGLAGFAEEVAISIRERFEATGHPRDMTIWHACGLGNGKNKGIFHLTQPGMIKRIVGGHFGVGGPVLMQLIMDSRIEAYNLPQGVLVVLPREMAAGRPGLITKVGLETFVDPRIEGGKLNSATTEEIVERVDFDGQEWLFYRAPRIDVALIRGTTADENGNLTVEDEGIFNESISIAQAAKAMDMSYKRAWYLMDEFNSMFADPLIERQHGGRGGGALDTGARSPRHGGDPRDDAGAARPGARARQAGFRARRHPRDRGTDRPHHRSDEDDEPDSLDACGHGHANPCRRRPAGRIRRTARHH